MKNILKVFAIAMLVAGTTAATAAEEAEKSDSVATPTEIVEKPAKVESARPARPPRGQRPQKAPNVEQYREELNKEARQIVALYDADKDGKLNEAERAQMDAEFAIAAKLQRYARTKIALDAVDADKNMVISETEVKKLQKAMRERMDRNGKRPMPPPPKMTQDGEKPAELPPPPPPAEAEKSTDAE